MMITFLGAGGTIVKDFHFSQVHNTSFYITESLLFSSFWLLFLPLLIIQWKKINPANSISERLIMAAVLTIVHLFGYAALVWVLSASFYAHTFSYWQTINYGLSDYSIMTMLVYGLPVILFSVYKNNFQKQVSSAENLSVPPRNFITSLLVSESNYKKRSIDVKDIQYFSANSPYINIHHPAGRYLKTGTLRSLETELNDHQFIRIHKSCIVNIRKVVSYQSRHNGDYDLTLTDGSALRLSRNYAANFKEKYKSAHRPGTE